MAYQGAGSKVTIPKGVTKIGERAFDGCDALTKVTIPAGVTEIGDYAFYDCSEKLALYGEKDSVAERYAKKKGYSFFVK